MDIGLILNNLASSLDELRMNIAGVANSLAASRNQQGLIMTNPMNAYSINNYTNSIQSLSQHIQSLTHQLSYMSQNRACYPPIPNANERATAIAQLLMGTERSLQNVLNTFFLSPQPAGLQIDCVTYNAEYALCTATQVVFDAQSAILKTDWSLYEPTVFTNQVPQIFPTVPTLQVVPAFNNATVSQGTCMVIMPDGSVQTFNFTY